MLRCDAALQSTIRVMAAMLCLHAGVVAASDLQMSVEATPQQIYLGDSVTLTVKVSGISNAPEPDLSAINNCTSVLQGSQDQSYHHVSIINGKIERIAFKGRLFTFIVTPNRTGRIPLSPVRLTYEGDVYQATGPTISVVGAEQQDRVLARLTASRNSVIVNEPFDITVAVSLKRLTDSYANIDPFDLGNPPELTIPHLEFNPIAGLEQEDPQELLQSLVTEGRLIPGFGINGVNLARNPLDSFFSMGGPMGNNRAVFRFERSAEMIDNTPYLTYRLRTHYVPTQEGTYTFGPIVFKGAVFTAVDAAGQASARRIFATAPAITVDVVPPPREGRPASYTGAIGSNLVAEASLDTQTCNVGDPLTLTLTVRGAFSVDNLSPPVLSQQKGLGETFRVYDDSVESQSLDDGKRFTYTIRPIRAGTLEFPAVDVAYYDSLTRTYRVVRTDPIPLVAYEAAEVQEDFVLAATNHTRAALADAASEGLFPAPITVVASGAQPASPWLTSWQRWTLILGPVFFAGVGVVVFILIRLTTTAESRRRKAALAEAIRLIDQAVRKAERTPDEGRTLLIGGLRKYLANRLGASEGGITPHDAARLLRRHNVDPELSRALVDILDRSFHAQYDAATATAQDVPTDARTVRSALKHLQKLTLTLCILFALTLTAHADQVRNRFLWQEANTHMATAEEPQDFLEAANSYRELYAAGIHNGALLYNMGTAFLMAEHYDAAQRALRAAEVYTGTTPLIERNMMLALKAGNPTSDVTLPWYRLPLFWHFSIPLHQRITGTVIAITLVWLMAALRLIAGRQRGTLLFAGAVVLAVILGSSVLTSLHQLNQVHTELLMLRNTDATPAALSATPPSETETSDA